MRSFPDSFVDKAVPLEPVMDLNEQKGKNMVMDTRLYMAYPQELFKS